MSAPVGTEAVTDRLLESVATNASNTLKGNLHRSEERQMVGKVPDETDVLVGKRMRVRRLEKGLSQGKIGEHLGVTFQQVQKYEKGTNRIGASRLKAIAAVLDVRVDYFFDEGEVGVRGPADTAEVLDLLAAPDVIGLLRDFTRIPDREARRALCTMAKALSAVDGNGSPVLQPH